MGDTQTKKNKKDKGCDEKMKNKTIKIIGIGAAALILMMIFTPLCMATGGEPNKYARQNPEKPELCNQYLEKCPGPDGSYRITKYMQDSDNDGKCNFYWERTSNGFLVKYDNDKDGIYEWKGTGTFTQNGVLIWTWEHTNVPADPMPNYDKAYRPMPEGVPYKPIPPDINTNSEPGIQIDQVPMLTTPVVI